MASKDFTQKTIPEMIMDQMIERLSEHEAFPAEVVDKLRDTFTGDAAITAENLMTSLAENIARTIDEDSST